jgi:hypothetical protein
MTFYRGRVKQSKRSLKFTLAPSLDRLLRRSMTLNEQSKPIEAGSRNIRKPMNTFANCVLASSVVKSYHRFHPAIGTPR